MIFYSMESRNKRQGKYHVSCSNAYRPTKCCCIQPRCFIFLEYNRNYNLHIKENISRMLEVSLLLVGFFIFGGVCCNCVPFCYSTRSTVPEIRSTLLILDTASLMRSTDEERLYTNDEDLSSSEDEQRNGRMCQNSTVSHLPTSEYVTPITCANEICAMCTEDLKNRDIIIRLPCMHIFHNTADCNLILQWILQKKSCPICLQSIDYSD